MEQLLLGLPAYFARVTLILDYWKPALRGNNNKNTSHNWPVSLFSHTPLTIGAVTYPYPLFLKINISDFPITSSPSSTLIVNNVSTFLFPEGEISFSKGASTSLGWHVLICYLDDLQSRAYDAMGLPMESVKGLLWKKSYYLLSLYPFAWSSDWFLHIYSLIRCSQNLLNHHSRMIWLDNPHQISINIQSPVKHLYHL